MAVAALVLRPPVPVVEEVAVRLRPALQASRGREASVPEGQPLAVTSKIMVILACLLFDEQFMCSNQHYSIVIGTTLGKFTQVLRLRLIYYKSLKATLAFYTAE